MKASIVIGANYGDEGKGTVVANLTKESTNVLNVLTNGGSQRGHSILTKDGSMTFQHFGSGTYHGADNYYSAWYILNPMQFTQEYKELIVKPTHIFRDHRCRWSTPYDVMANLIQEEQRGRKASCGMGIWNTIQRCDRQPIVTFDDFMQHPERWVQYLGNVRKYYEKFVDIPDKWRDIWQGDGVIKHFLNDCKFMQAHTETANLSALTTYEDIIFENGQGLMLRDTGHDTADTTPSDTGLRYALSMARDLGIEDITAHYVTRPYLTRHGDGNLIGQTKRTSIATTVEEDRTNHFNDHQGEFRYGLLDIQDLYDRIGEDLCRNSALIGVRLELDVTHCDEMDREAEFRKEFLNVNTYDNPLV